MPFVVDASVTLAWCFEDEAKPETEAILDLLSDDTAIVPSLWELEVSDVLLLGERRRCQTESQMARFVALLGQCRSSLTLRVSICRLFLPWAATTRLLHKMRPTSYWPNAKASPWPHWMPNCVTPLRLVATALRFAGR